MPEHEDINSAGRDDHAGAVRTGHDTNEHDTNEHAPLFGKLAGIVQRDTDRRTREQAPPETPPEVAPVSEPPKKELDDGIIRWRKQLDNLGNVLMEEFHVIPGGKTNVTQAAITLLRIQHDEIKALNKMHLREIHRLEHVVCYHTPGGTTYREFIEVVDKEMREIKGLTENPPQESPPEGEFKPLVRTPEYVKMENTYIKEARRLRFALRKYYPNYTTGRETIRKIDAEMEQGK